MRGQILLLCLLASPNLATDVPVASVETQARLEGKIKLSSASSIEAVSFTGGQTKSDFENAITEAAKEGAGVGLLPVRTPYHITVLGAEQVDSVSVTVSFELKFEACKRATPLEVEHMFVNLRKAILDGRLQLLLQQEGIVVEHLGFPAGGQDWVVRTCESASPTPAPAVVESKPVAPAGGFASAKVVAVVQMYGLQPSVFLRNEKAYRTDFVSVLEHQIAGRLIQTLKLDLSGDSDARDALKTIRVLITDDATSTTTQEQVNAEVMYDPTDSGVQYSGSARKVHFQVVFGGSVRCTSGMNDLATATPVALRKVLESGELMHGWAQKGLNPTAIGLQQCMALSCADALSPTQQPTKPAAENAPLAAAEAQQIAALEEEAAVANKYYHSSAEPKGTVFIGGALPDTGKSHFQVGKSLAPGVQVFLHVFGLDPAEFEHTDAQLAFRHAIQDALCPAGPGFPETCHWSTVAGQTVTLHSFKATEALGPGEVVFDVAGPVQQSMVKHLFPHGVLVNFRVELTAARGCTEQGVEQQLLEELPKRITELVESRGLLLYLHGLGVHALGLTQDPHLYRSCKPFIDLQLPNNVIGTSNSEMDMEPAKDVKCVWLGSKIHIVHRDTLEWKCWQPGADHGVLKNVGGLGCAHRQDYTEFAERSSLTPAGPETGDNFFCRHYVNPSGAHACTCHTQHFIVHTAVPTTVPTPVPTAAPTTVPSPVPTATPTVVPTPAPTPTAMPTSTPTPVPTTSPTSAPTKEFTPDPTNAPTKMPTDVPTAPPTDAWWNEDLPTTAPTQGLTQDAGGGGETGGNDTGGLNPILPLPTEAPTANACDGGRVWKTCGGCQATCNDPHPVCAAVCSEGCECPASLPVLFQGTQCIKSASCPAAPPSAIFQLGDCSMTPWSAADDAVCSKTCGGGEAIQTRVLLAPAQPGGSPCSDNGNTVRMASCNTQPCATSPPTDAPTEVSAVEATAGPTSLPTATPTKMIAAMVRDQELAGIDGDVGAMAGDADNLWVGTGSQLVRVVKGVGQSKMSTAASITLLQSGFKDVTAIEVGPGGAHIFVIMHRIHDGAYVLRKLVADTLEATGEEYAFEKTDGIPYTMSADATGSSIYTGHSTFPGRVLKLDMVSMALQKRAILWAGEDDVRWVELDATHVFAYTKTSPGKIVKLEKTELARQKAVDLTTGSDEPLSGCTSGGYVYASSSTSPAIVSKYDADELTLVASNTLDGVGMVVAMECGNDYLYTASFTKEAYIARIRKSDLGQQSWVSLAEGGHPGMAAVLVAGKNDHLYVGTDSGPGVVYKVRGFDAPQVATPPPPLAAEEEAP
jgi:hypothetical protein